MRLTLKPVFKTVSTKRYWWGSNVYQKRLWVMVNYKQFLKVNLNANLQWNMLSMKL